MVSNKRFLHRKVHFATTPYELFFKKIYNQSMLWILEYLSFDRKQL